MKLSPTFIATVLSVIARILQLSLRITIARAPKYDSNTQYIFAFWHGKQLLPIWCYKDANYTKHAVLTSSSRDGEILSIWLRKLGYHTVRGSSRRDNLQALKGMLKVLQAGYSLGFAIDGPKGPIYKVKPGTTHMAQKLNIAIVPVGSAFSRQCIITSAWDKFVIPMPFAKAILYLGEPIIVTKDCNLEIANQQLEIAIQTAESKATELLSSKK